MAVVPSPALATNSPCEACVDCTDEGQSLYGVGITTDPGTSGDPRKPVSTGDLWTAGTQFLADACFFSSRIRDVYLTTDQCQTYLYTTHDVPGSIYGDLYVSDHNGENDYLLSPILGYNGVTTICSTDPVNSSGSIHFGAANPGTYTVQVHATAIHLCCATGAPDEQTKVSDPITFYVSDRPDDINDGPTTVTAPRASRSTSPMAMSGSSRPTTTAPGQEAA
jgi:hypothetical protein